MDRLLVILMLLPLVSALLILLMPHASAAVVRLATALTTGVTLVMSLVLFVRFDPAVAGYQFVFDEPWLPALGIRFSMGLDGVSLPAFLLAALVAFAGSLATRDIRNRVKEFHVLYLVLVTGAFGAFAATDLFFFYFFAEFEVLVIYLLIAGWGRLPAADGPGALPRAAMRMTLFAGGGALLALLGVMALWSLGGGTFSLSGLAAALRDHPLPVPTQRAVFVLFVAGFGTLLAMWPLHAWSPPAYAAAPTAISMFAAGALKQVGAYGLLRIAIPLLPDGARWAAPALAVAGAVNILYGGLIALRQKDWKQLIAYTSISHAGYVLIGLSALNAIGLGGVALMMFAHGAATALLFGLAGHIEEQTGDRDIARFGGLARTAPFLGFALVLAALAAVGLPGFSGFVSELMVFAGGWQQGSAAVRAAVVAGIWGLVLTAVYALGAVRFGVFGPPTAGAAHVADLDTWARRLPFVLLIAALIATGIFPRLLTDPIRRTLESATPAAVQQAAAPAPASGSVAR